MYHFKIYAYDRRLTKAEGHKKRDHACSVIRAGKETASAARITSG